MALKETISSVPYFVLIFLHGKLGMKGIFRPSANHP